MHLSLLCTPTSTTDLLSNNVARLAALEVMAQNIWLDLHTGNAATTDAETSVGLAALMAKTKGAQRCGFQSYATSR